MHEMLVQAAIDFAIKVAKIHEIDVHDGEPCPDERANLVAYLAHRLGINLDLFYESLTDYEVHHEAFKARERKGNG